MRIPKVSLGVQSIAILLLPLLTLAWLTVHEVNAANHVVQQSERQQLFSQVAGAFGAVIHETQNERGFSTATLAKDSAALRSELSRQRDRRDASVKAVVDLVADIDISALGPVFKQELDNVLSFEPRLAKLRRGVDTSDLDFLGIVEVYDAAVQSYIRCVGMISEFSDDPDIASLGDALAFLLQVKELSSIERDRLGEAFANDAFTLEALEFVAMILAQQDVYLTEMQQSLTATQKTFVDSLLKEASVQNALRLRDLAMSRRHTGGFEVAPADWVEAQTAKIDVLRKIEKHFLDQIFAMTQVLQDDAQARKRTASALGMFAMMVVVFAIGWNIVKFGGLKRDLGADAVRLNDALMALGRGDFSVDLSTGRDATGVMAGLQDMQVLLRQQAERDQRLLSESLRIRQALDNVQDPVVVADNDLTVVFGNKAAESLGPALGRALSSGGQSLVGENISVFYSESGTSTASLSTLSGSEVTDMTLGDLHLRVTASPVLDANDQRMGLILVLLDRTSEVALENEVQAVVNAAKSGNLSKRISASDVSGFLAVLSSSVNSLLDVAEQVVDDTGRIFSAVSRGDLSQIIDNEYEGRFETLKKDANATVQSLGEVVDGIRTAASTVRSGVADIATGNSALRERTEEQSRSLERSRLAMEDITGMVRSSSESATRADQLAHEAQAKAEEGGSVVGQTVSAMQEIHASSQQIDDIISVIDEIAFQTNLLALNAAVEAARAGEQGRGFAVVAKEVRALAGRSATAAKEIGSLIQDSSSKVNDGMRLVDASGKTLQDIVTRVQGLSEAVSEIAMASQKQNRKIDEVNDGIIQIDAFTQQNAALVTQAAGASKTLKLQSEQLDGHINFFASENAPAARSQPAAIELRRSA